MANQNKNRYAAHQLAVKQILLACGSRPDCRLWSNNTGMGRALTHNATIRFGLVGSADILGIGPQGRFIAIEVKTGKATQSKAQKAFEQMILCFGGFYFVVSSAEEAASFLDGIMGSSKPF